MWTAAIIVGTILVFGLAMWADHLIQEWRGRPRPNPKRFSDGFRDEPIVFKRHDPDFKPAPRSITQAGPLGGSGTPKMVFGSPSVTRTRGMIFGGPSGAGHYPSAPQPVADPATLAVGIMVGEAINSTPEAPAAPVDTGASCPDTGFTSSYDSGGGGFDGGSSGGGGE